MNAQTQIRPSARYVTEIVTDYDGTAHFSPVVAVRTGAAAVEVFLSVFAESLAVRPPSFPLTISLQRPTFAAQ